MEGNPSQLAKTATRGQVAARGGRATRYFGARLRAERERRNWTQVEMAARLAEAGWPVNPTMLAKIERANEDARRSVKVDEALAVAEVFGMSLDSLLGRTTDAESSDELALTLCRALDTASTLVGQLVKIGHTWHDGFIDVPALDFPGREELEEHFLAGGEAIAAAGREFAKIAALPRPGPDTYQVTLRAPLRRAAARLGGRGALTAEEQDTEAHAGEEPGTDGEQTQNGEQSA